MHARPEGPLGRKMGTAQGGGSPVVTMAFNIKMDDLDDLGVPQPRSNGALKHKKNGDIWGL